MKKQLKLVLGILGGILLVLCGILMGGYMSDQNHQLSENKLFTTTKIAVVNLDEGIEYEGQHRNFASELLSAQTQDLVITGLSDAKAGIQTGTYGAYLIIPADFSTNVTTVNSAPKKSLLKYEISESLSDVSRDKTTLDVAQLNDSINNDLGYMYLYSLFNEIHTGQNNAIKVMTNDSKDKEVLMAISNIDLIESIDIKEVERLENNIQNLEISADFDENQAIIDSVDLAYKGYLGKLEDETSSIKTDSVTVDKNLQILNIEVSNIPTLGQGEAKNYSLSNSNATLASFNTNLMMVNNDISQSLSNTQGKNNQVANEMKSNANSFLGTVDGFNQNLDDGNNYDDLKTKLNTTINGIDMDQMPTLKAELDVLYTENNQLEIKVNELEAEIQILKNSITNEENRKLIEEYLFNTALGLANDTAITNQEELLNEIYTQTKPTDLINEKIKDYAMKNELTQVTDLKSYYEYTRSAVPLNTNVTNDSGDVVTNPDDGVLIDYSSIVTAVKTDMLSITSELMLDFDTAISNYPTTIEIQDFQNSITKFEGDLPKFDDIIHSINEVKGIQLDEINMGIETDLAPLAKLQDKTKEDLKILMNGNLNESNTFVNRVNIYNPLAFINEREVASFISDYKLNKAGIESKITNKDFEYKSFVDDSYQNANKQVFSLKEDIYDYQKRSDEQLTTGLEGAKSSRLNSSLQNQTLMSSFVNTLPYSRLGDAENTTAYQFMINPVMRETTTLASNNTKMGYDYNFLIITVMGGIVVVMIVIIGASTYYERKKVLNTKNI